jgi:thiol-disulfide isomerase/thioredoxin
MKLIKTCLTAGILFALSLAQADESFPILKSGDNVYSNVTVTSVTATDIYFTYSGGIGNAKLKSLDPAMQKHFHFDPAKAVKAEKTQAAATVQFQHNLLAAKASPKLPGPTYDTGDLVAPKIFAKSFRGEVPPQIFVEHWLTPAPVVDGKFVMVVFWTAGPEQCRDVIPRLNDFAAKFKDKLTIIALSNEPVDDITKAKLPPINFSVGTDTQSRSLTAFEVTAIPHTVVIDPANIVRYEGPPVFLEEKDLAHLLATYAQ